VAIGGAKVLAELAEFRRNEFVRRDLAV